MPLFHGIYSSSAPKYIGVTVCDPSTNKRALTYAITEITPWHNPILPEIRPFSPNLHILIDDKQNLKYYILRPPPDQWPFSYIHLPTVSSIMGIRRCSGKAVIETVHNAFGIQKLRDFKSGQCYTILTARSAPPHSIDPTSPTAIIDSRKSLQINPYVIRPGAQLPRIIASGDLYPLEYGSHFLEVPTSEQEFEKASADIYRWYLEGFPWLSAIPGAKRCVRIKARKDCQMLAQQCRWRTGGWLLDHHIQRFYNPRGSYCEIPPHDSNVMAGHLADDQVISANPSDYVEGSWITDGLYKRTRITLHRKYLMEFPWFEISSLKRKVEYDIGFLHTAHQLMKFPYRLIDGTIIHTKTLQDKDIIAFYDADIYDLVNIHSQENSNAGKERRLQARMEKHAPHINVDLAAMPDSWKNLMGLDEEEANKEPNRHSSFEVLSGRSAKPRRTHRPEHSI
ncbi:hypothetical protein NHQ30_011038 [Ciborinia camelliae]|nr:hypothetical protein NHQ30_011038 [Ciborinia camelliae]